MAKAQTLVDNFADDAIDPAKWVTFGGPVAETNGRIEIRPASGVVGSSGLLSAAGYDLLESHFVVELVRPLRGGPGTETVVRAKLDDSNFVSFTVVNGMLRMQQRAWGYDYTDTSVLYDPSAHRWLRLRGIATASRTTRWDVSADGCTWETLLSDYQYVSLGSGGVLLELAAVTTQAVPAPGVAIFDNVNTPEARRARRVEERRLSARDVRVEAAELAARLRHDEHANNDDEASYPGYSFIGNYSKSLPHDYLGDPDPVAYGTLLRALESRDPADFEVIRLAMPTSIKLTNPQAGLTFDLEGPDPQAITQPPAPRFDSEQTAHEAGELYWMAVARDIPFIYYDWDGTIASAVNSLNAEFPQFGGTVGVSTQNVFRGIFPGEQTGPYVSQYLLKGNVDPRKPAGMGRDATDGFISYGSRVINQRLIPATANLDYLTDFPWWLDAQNGKDFRGTDSFDTTPRFIWNLRAGATFVHFDQVIDAFYNAAWILMSEPTGDQLSTATGRPQIDLEFPKNQGNPYDPPGMAMDSRTQVGFATFGQTHMLQVLSEVLGRALRAVWWQKWGVHRRLRPEEYGGRVHNHIVGARAYPLHPSITDSLKGGGLSPYFGDWWEKFPHSFLLPQAYPEGAPTHPAYGAGHSTGSGALITILKAFFDDTAPIENPVVASADGLSLLPYTGWDAGLMTVGGELNKLAGNISLFRNAAGVHWRSDYTESMILGEAVAIRLLQEMTLGFNEDDGFFELTRLDGVRIRISDGKVTAV
jgi:hypothetical protein